MEKNHSSYSDMFFNFEDCPSCEKKYCSTQDLVLVVTGRARCSICGYRGDHYPPPPRQNPKPAFFSKKMDLKQPLKTNKN